LRKKNLKKFWGKNYCAAVASAVLLSVVTILGSCKNEEKKSRLNHHSPKEVPYGFQYGFRMEYGFRSRSIPYGTSIWIPVWIP
jgi:hypothetical protein